MSNKKLTSKDIARELGISRSVVSFVLNGKSKEMRISDELTRKVLDYVATHNYQPNHTAKSLKTGKSNTLGLIVADISNPFFSTMARFIENEATRKGYSIIFCSSDENKNNFLKQLNNLKNRNVDGLILTPPIGSENVIKVLNSQKFPNVVIDRFFENIPGNYVTINNHQSAYDATMRLIKNNRKKIAFINVNNELYTMNQRTRGYLTALKDSGLKRNNKFIKQLNYSHITEDVKKVVKEVIDNNVDAILFTTNKLGVTGIQTIKKLGKSIPEDIAVFSFDDTDTYILASTPISAIKQPLEKICKEAVELLDKIINSDVSPTEFESIVLETELVLRESCP